MVGIRTRDLRKVYTSAPPFAAGTPEQAGPELTALARAQTHELNARILKVATSQRSA